MRSLTLMSDVTASDPVVDLGLGKKNKKTDLSQKYINIFWSIVSFTISFFFSESVNGMKVQINVLYLTETDEYV